MSKGKKVRSKYFDVFQSIILFLTSYSLPLTSIQAVYKVLSNQEKELLQFCGWLHGLRQYH